MPYCPKCAYEYESGNRFCPLCGATMPKDKKLQEYSEENEQDRNAKLICTMALIFGILGGVLGFVFAIMGFKMDKKNHYYKRTLIGLVACIVWFSAVLVYFLIKKFF